MFNLIRRVLQALRSQTPQVPSNYHRGTYKITNLQTGKTYVGSSAKLAHRSTLFADVAKSIIVGVGLGALAYSISVSGLF